MIRKASIVGGTVAAAALAIAVVLSLHSRGRVIHLEWMAGLVWLIPALLCAEFVQRRRAAGGGETAQPEDLVPALVLLGLMLLYLFSSATTHSSFFFAQWALVGGWRSRLWSSAPARFLLATALLTPVCLFPLRRKMWIVLLVALVAFQLACARALLEQSGGLPLYGYDHPSFMMRLWAFGKTCPRLIYYNPLWNAGKVAAYGVASGTTTPGLLLWPLWRFLPIEQAYAVAIPLLFIGLVPLVTAGAVGLAGGSRTAAFAAGLLALNVSRQWFVWSLHFGTVGASLAMAFIPLVAAALYRAIWLKRTSPWVGAVLVLSSFLFLAWPATSVMAVPLCLAAVAGVRQWSKRTILFLAICTVVLVLLSLPTLLSSLGRVDMEHFASGRKAELSWLKVLPGGWIRLARLVREGHPLLLFLGILGVFCLPDRGVRVFFGTALAGLALLTGWGKEIKPQLELGRAILPLFFLAAVPAGLWAARILENQTARLAIARAALLALLGMGGFQALAYYRNATFVNYRVMPQEVMNLAAWIRTNTPEDGRIMFAGYATHGYGGGTVAALPLLTGREMLSCDYYQFSPKRVEYNYPPRPWRKTMPKVYAYAELYNVTHIITFHENWIEELRAHPELFEEACSFPSPKRERVVFRVLRDSRLFLEGSGSVDADVNEIRVRVDDPQEEIVLKYHWADGLETDPGVEIEPHSIHEDIVFIRARPNGRASFSIRYRGWF
ncbi:MAG: hypothetical protein JXB04_11825 [Kiritimatiellae bacterium]|nr:hypothetical protein [Kiritimatiellia bacterium]